MDASRSHARQKIHPSLASPRHDQPTQRGLIIDPQWTLEDIENKVIDWTLERFDGNRQATAKHLGIGVRTLYRRLKDEPNSDR